MRTPDEIISLRRVVIERFHRLNRVPTVTINMDARVEAALAFKDRANASPRGAAHKVTLNHVVLKATAMALREHLFFNHDYNGRGIIWENERIDIRTPVDMGEFPMHIVVPETDRKDVYEIAQAFNEKLDEVRGKIGTLMDKYVAFQRDRRLLSAGLNALTAFSRVARPLVPAWDRRWYSWQHKVMGTFMVTNMGTLGVIDCHGQLVRPSIGALLVLAVRDVVEVENGLPVVRRYLPLAVEFDNRVAETAQAGAFLAAIKRNVEEPEKYCA